LTSHNVVEKDLKGANPISREHEENSRAVRKMLGERGVKPENLPAGEDTKKLKRKLESEDKKNAQGSKKEKMSLKNVQYCSDLHLEFPVNKQFFLDNPLIPKSEILVLAGDIVPFHLIDKQSDFFSYVSDHFRTTYWIPGNHEYYHNDISKRNGSFSEFIRKNVVLLNNTTIIEDDVALIFSTLWSKIQADQEQAIKRGMNDFRIISKGDVNFAPKDCTRLFEENFNFIKSEIETHTDKKQIVVTHHVPTYQHYPAEYFGSSLNSAFATDLDTFIENTAINAWIFGHHHRNTSSFKIGNTQMHTNQLGYVQMLENVGFDPAKTLEL
jgi:predicted phosphohydrolase